MQFNQFLGDEKSHSPNGRVICDLHSPDTFDTRLGEWASANVQPCIMEERKQIRRNGRMEGLKDRRIERRKEANKEKCKDGRIEGQKNREKKGSK